ncbi:M23 family metallopeptidase [Pseudahrensia aquimaris]|uniref:M23 family metallopeptidase n=1 Tax=Pseudahrensia aquimaris TaxID=744461 RepID=A0ABW3FDE3_9HYPH
MADDRFMEPGDLLPNSGKGWRSDRVFLPKLRFPIEKQNAYANSQVYRPGGNKGPSGGQCSASNYKYPWQDNFCEKRRWKMPFCPTGKGHQGQDIRPNTCDKDFYWTVAAEAGVITNVGKYSVTLLGSSGTIYRYLHVQMNDLAVAKGDKVKIGSRIGKVSNSFGNSSTTIHLHFDAKKTVISKGKRVTAYIPIYTSLVESYKRLD